MNYHCVDKNMDIIKGTSIKNGWLVKKEKKIPWTYFSEQFLLFNLL